MPCPRTTIPGHCPYVVCLLVVAKWARMARMSSPALRPETRAVSQRLRLPFGLRSRLRPPGGLLPPHTYPPGTGPQPKILQLAGFCLAARTGTNQCWSSSSITLSSLFSIIYFFPFSPIIVISPFLVFTLVPSPATSNTSSFLPRSSSTTRSYTKRRFSQACRQGTNFVLFSLSLTHTHTSAPW